MVHLREVPNLLQLLQDRAPHLAIVDLEELDGVVLADRLPRRLVDEAEHARAELGRDLKPAHVAGLAVVGVERLPVGSCWDGAFLVR